MTKTVTLDKATRFLESMRMLSLEEIGYLFERVLLFSQTIQALKRLYPKTYERKLEDFPKLSSSLLNDREPVTEGLFSFIGKVFGKFFPLDEDYMNMQFSEMEVGDLCFIAIQPIGFCASEEDIEEIARGVSPFGEDDDVLIVLKLLNTFSLEPETWEEISSRRSWGIPVPVFFHQKWQDRQSFDFDKFHRLLARFQLEEYELVLDYVSNQTGNYLVDYNPYDEGNSSYEPIEFNADNLVGLVQCGREANRILKKVKNAITRTQRDPTIIKKLVRIFSASMTPGEEYLEIAGKQLTLAGVFCGENEKEVLEDANIDI